MPRDGDALQPGATPRRNGKIGRLRCENFELSLSGGVNAAGETASHPIIVSVAWNDAGHVHEVVIEGRGKSGHGINIMMHDLSIAISRILQNRDPITGNPTE